MKQNENFSLDSPEFRLLAACTGSVPSSRPPARVAGSFSWNVFLNLAAHCQVETFLYYRIRQMEITVPEEVLEALKARYHMVSGFQLGYFKVLARLFSQFNRAGVDLILLKGAAISRQLYPQTACRTFGDIDLLVRESDLPAAEKIFRKDLTLALGRPEKGVIRKCIFHKLYTYPSGPESVLKFELHWSLFSEDALIKYPLERLWENLAEVEISPGVIGKSLSPIHQFLHLCWHLNAHYFAALRDFWDLDRLVTRQGFDWDELRDIADRYRFHNRIYHSLRLLRRILGTDLGVRLDKFSPAGRRWFPRELEGDGLLNKVCDRKKDLRTVVELSLKDSWKEKSVFLKRLAVPGACWFSIFPGEPAWPVMTQPFRHFLRGIRLYFFLAGYFLSKWFGF